ncbi:MAG: hypothetical protein AAF687_02040 [Pseudomonadota bacterium]
MKRLAILMIPAVCSLGACSKLDPWDGSEYEEAEKPISQQTNQTMVSDMNAAPKVDPSNPLAQQQQEPDDWGASTPR